MLSLPAKFAVKFNGLVPGITADQIVPWRGASALIARRLEAQRCVSRNRRGEQRGKPEIREIRRSLVSSDQTVVRLFLQVHVRYFINHLSQKALPQMPKLLRGISNEKLKPRISTPLLIRDDGRRQKLS